MCNVLSQRLPKLYILRSVHTHTYVLCQRREKMKGRRRRNRKKSLSLSPYRCNDTQKYREHWEGGGIDLLVDKYQSSVRLIFLYFFALLGLSSWPVLSIL